MGATADGPTLDALVDELGRVAWDADEARTLALRAGFPPADLPVLKTPRMFWSQVVQAADDGKVRGGVQALADEAAKQYPFNNFFANYPARTIADQQVESAQEQPSKSASGTGRPDVARPEDRASPYRPKVAHRVTQLDRDRFVRSTFGTIRDYFQRGLSAMEGEHAGFLLPRLLEPLAPPPQPLRIEPLLSSKRSITQTTSQLLRKHLLRLGLGPPLGHLLGHARRLDRSDGACLPGVGRALTLLWLVRAPNDRRHP